MRGVPGNRLAGAAARQQAQENREVRGARNELLDAHAGDMQARQAGAHIRIAFIGADDDASGLGDGEVDAGESGLGAHELAAEMAAGGFGEVLGIRRALLGAELDVEEFADFFPLQMDGRHDDMAGRLLAELHDAFAEVGVGDFDAAGLEVGIEMALFGEHRLRLDELRDAVAREDLMNDGVVFGGIASPMDLNAVGGGIALKLLQVIGEAGESMRLNCGGGFAKGFPFGDAGGLPVAFGAHKPERLVMPMRAVFIGDKGSGFFGVAGHESFAFSRISATCMTRCG